MDYYILQFMRNKHKKKVWFLALITVNQHMHIYARTIRIVPITPFKKKARNKHVAVLKYASPMFKKYE